MPDPAPQAPSSPQEPSESSSATRSFQEEVVACRPFLLAKAKRQWRDDPEDLTHDVIEKALRKHAFYRPGTNLRAWLATILQNAVVDRIRKRTSRPELSVPDVPGSTEPPEPPPWWTQLDIETIDAAARELPPDLRAVFELHRQGRRYQEMAAELGIPVNTVATRLYRARRMLRTRLTEQWHDGRKST